MRVAVLCLAAMSFSCACRQAYAIEPKVDPDKRVVSTQRAAAVSPRPAPHIDDAVVAADSAIRGGSMLRLATRLASPALRGRAAGTVDARKASTIVADEMRRLGLLPGGTGGTYFQAFTINGGYQVQARLGSQVAGRARTLVRRRDYGILHLPRHAAAVDGGCALVGYGSRAPNGLDEWAGVDLTGKAAFVFAGTAAATPAVDAVGARLARLGERRGDLVRKAKTAAQRGASALFVIPDPSGWRSRVHARTLLSVLDMQFPLPAPIPVVQLSPAGATRLLGTPERTLRKWSRAIRNGHHVQSRELPRCHTRFDASARGHARVGRNVIGVLPGSDPVLRSEAVVIGAHYDHLGENGQGTFFGANDNASGTSAVLAIARAFAKLPAHARPRRTVVFVAFGAEEIGKLGSRNYVARPPIALDRTSLMINFDMIGRNQPNEINAVATRSSAGLQRLHRLANRYVGLTIKHPRSLRLGRSDHSPFYLAEVPVMYLFGGLHPGYHTIRDTIDKLEPVKMERVARLAFLTAWLAAQRQQQLRFQSN